MKRQEKALSFWFLSSPIHTGFPSCHLISLAHQWSLLLSCSCARRTLRLSASVNLFILRRMQAAREGGRRFFYCGPTGIFLKSSSCAQHSSNVTQILITEECLLCLSFFFLVLLYLWFCSMRPSPTGSQQGHPGFHTWLDFGKPWLRSQGQAGGQARLGSLDC